MREWIVSTLGGGATALGIVVAMIGLAGALGGALSSYFVAQKTVYINAITTERMKWVASLRDNVATLLGEITVVKAFARGEDASKRHALLQSLKSMNKTGKLLELQLNPSGLIDGTVLDLLRALYRTTGKANIDKIDVVSDALVDHSQWLLKAEWERVKTEACGPFMRGIRKVYEWRANARYKAYRESDKRLQVAEALVGTTPRVDLVEHQ